jgi:hypothetical protein
MIISDLQIMLKNLRIMLDGIMGVSGASCWFEKSSVDHRASRRKNADESAG